MDALTNVVAVLILVLILVQADVTRKVTKFLDDLKPATPEQVEQSRKQLQDVVRKKESVAEKLRQDAPTADQIEAEKRNIALLEKSLENNDKLLADLGELKKLESKVRKERDSENAVTVGIQEEIAKLEAQLDRTPVLQAPLPTEVTIPNSRPIPPKATIYQAIALKDRIHIIDPSGPLAVFDNEFKKNKNDWVVSRIKQKGADRIIYDQKKIAAHFKGFDFGNNLNQKVEVITNPMSTRVQIAITPDPLKGGTPIDELEKKGSEFSRIVASLKSNIRAVVLFNVNPDSFNAYLKARGLLDRVKIPAGWDVSGASSHRFTIPDLEVKRLQEPPPPAANPGPKPPTIGPKLD